MSERHTRIVGNERHVWHTERLWELARGLQPFVVAIDQIPETDIDCWFDGAPTLRALAEHAQRIEQADPKFPIILNADGELMDGGHRICKALMHGHATITAVRFETTPEPDEKLPLDGAG